jgi:hypothetical protein
MNRVDSLHLLKLYRGMGFSLVPLRRRAKIPLVKWKDYKPTDQELFDFFARGVNWAIRCDERFHALDFDSSQDYHRFLEQSGTLLQNAPTVRTGRGYHVWFKPKRPVKSFSQDGMEVKGLGSLVTVPPSIHPSGAEYTFERPLDGALPEIDIEELVPQKQPCGLPLAQGQTVVVPESSLVFANGPRHRRPALRKHTPPALRQKVKDLLEQYLPGCRELGGELAGYTHPDSASRAHIKVNLDKGVYMDWRKNQGGTVAELLRLLGAPVPQELGGMGEEDIPEYFPIWAVDRNWHEEWVCGEPVVVYRQDGVPRWSGKAFCLQWSCPECAIRLKNVLKRRLSAMELSVFEAQGSPVKALRKLKRKYPHLSYLRLKGKKEYVLIRDGPEPSAIEGLAPMLSPSTKSPEEAVDELPLREVQRRERRVIPGRGFWEGRVNNITLHRENMEGKYSNSTSQDLVVLRADYSEVLRRLRSKGFEAIDTGLGESHRLMGQVPVAAEELGEVVHIIPLPRNRPEGPIAQESSSATAASPCQGPRSPG